MLLEIRHLFFSYSPDTKLFQNLNLNIEHGKTIALAGESGCGKSTLLSLIYGLFDWESGEMIFDGAPIYGPKKNIVPGEKEMKLVAQNYDLMPYATVADNVGKFISNINLAEKKERVQQLLEVVGLEDSANILPKFLSGGQQQRVAIARALSVMPKLLLLDEPFSNLDFSRKVVLRERLFKYVKENGISMIISTHEIQEVMPWLDQIVILKDGRLVQTDSPEITYKNPYNAYVAELFGEVNLFTEEEAQNLQLPRQIIYPHEIKIAESGAEAQVVESRFAGSYYWNKLQFGEKFLTVYSENQLSDTVNIEFQPKV